MGCWSPTSIAPNQTPAKATKHHEHGPLLCVCLGISPSFRRYQKLYCSVMEKIGCEKLAYGFWQDYRESEIFDHRVYGVTHDPLTY